jgi:hypothetical protein
MDKTYVVYTLKDQDHEGYKSLYQLYMRIGDPTEVRFADACFENFDHWKKVSECKWMQPFVNRWREELELRIRSEALAAVLHTARDEHSKFSYEANKYLLSGQWKPGSKDSVGRPSKEKIKREAEKLFQDEKETLEDFKRIMQ